LAKRIDRLEAAVALREIKSLPLRNTGALAARQFFVL
jgi:hypothetical protein